MIATIERWAGKAEAYYSCFLSHSSLDKKFAGKLYDDLRTDGVACWYSAEDLPPGALWKVELQENLRTAERVLVLVSSHSLQSAGVRDEMNAVLTPGQLTTSRIVPIKLLDDQTWKTADISWVVAARDSVQAVDFGDSIENYDRNYSKLLAALKKPGTTQDG